MFYVGNAHIYIVQVRLEKSRKFAISCGVKFQWSSLEVLAADPDPRLKFARTFVGSLPMRKLPGGGNFK